MDSNMLEEVDRVDQKEEQALDDTSPSLLEYTTRDGGSCELFKIEIQHIPFHANYASVSKFIKNKFNIKPHKIKICGGGRSKFAYVAFETENDRDVAMKEINGFIWKGRKLQTSLASPILDPFRLIQSQKKSDEVADIEKDNEQPSNKKRKVEDDSNDEQEQLSMEERLRRQVAPLAGTPYEGQLTIKKQEYEELLGDLLRETAKIINQSAKSKDRRKDSRTDELLKWSIERRKSGHAFCPIGLIVDCPVESRVGYRNKCEFSFGVNMSDGPEKPHVVIGFRLGAYKDGSINVGPVDSCSLVPDAMKVIVKELQGALNDPETPTRLRPFDFVTHEGNMTQLTVRTNARNESMVVLFVNQQSLSDADLKVDVDMISSHLRNKNVGVVSFYLQLVIKGNQPQPRLIDGQSVLTEELNVNGSLLKFNISPNAFFQINTKAAEKCYGTICHLLELDILCDNKNENGDVETPGTVILDICCGTGTIGLSLASKCKHVYGIEWSKAAVEDAKENAKINGITNVSFYDGKAESILPLVIQSIQRQHPTSKVVAILDPPRAGLNSSVIKSLRSNTQISKLVYVSCEPKLAKGNMIDLVRPVSKAYRGDPFIPVKSALVDMFPDTNRAETLFLFERLN